MSGYRLDIVPPPPTNDLWVDVLRWLVAVMDMDDPDLAFTSSLLSHCLNHGGLTDKQAKYARKIIARLTAHYEAGTLDFQQHNDLTFSVDGGANVH